MVLPLLVMILLWELFKLKRDDALDHPDAVFTVLFIVCGERIAPSAALAYCLLLFSVLPDARTWHAAQCKFDQSTIRVSVQLH